MSTTTTQAALREITGEEIDAVAGGSTILGIRLYGYGFRISVQDGAVCLSLRSPNAPTETVCGGN